MPSRWLTLDIRIIFMAFRPSFQGGGVHAKNLNVGKNTVSVTMRD